MHIISKRRLRESWERHADAEHDLRIWHSVVKARRYRTPHEVRAEFSASSFLGEGVTVFNIAGNKYRLVVTMRYDMGAVFIRHVVTHKEYDRLTKSGSL